MSVLDLGDKVLVTSERGRPMCRVVVRKFPQEDTENILSWIRRLRHANIVAALEVFSGQKIVYIVFEEMHISLDYLVRTPGKRTSDEVGLIIGQVWQSNHGAAGRSLTECRSWTASHISRPSPFAMAISAASLCLFTPLATSRLVCAVDLCYGARRLTGRRSEPGELRASQYGGFKKEHTGYR